jgi:oligopeptide transport system permease protein
MHLVPGGPFDREKELPPTVMANLERKYNLDKPIHEQYFLYLKDLVQGDLGTSFRQDREVSEIIREGFWVSAQLGLTAFAFALTLGMSLGIISALNRNNILDYVGVFFATIGASVPSFVVATLGIMIFSAELHWFDVLGWEFGNYKKMVLPVIALGLLPASFIARITRASMLEVLEQDYIRTARAKGLAEYVVVLRHVVKNSLIPVLTVSGPIFAVLITGSFIIERIFSIPGVGRPFVEAVFNRDYGVIMGTTVFFATAIAVANLIVDVLYATVDPRIRYG